MSLTVVCRASQSHDGVSALSFDPHPEKLPRLHTILAPASFPPSGDYYPVGITYTTRRGRSIDRYQSNQGHVGQPTVIGVGEWAK